MKDYYRTLEIAPNASSEEIQRAYRRLALKHHPDRNPEDPLSEERFKEISEAYGVLIDSEKRKHYDDWRDFGPQQAAPQGGFRYSQEEIFRDLFKNPHAQKIFGDLFREFERSGVRFDQHFFDRLFFGGRGILFGGVFVWGSFGPSAGRIFGPRSQDRIGLRDSQPLGPTGFMGRLGQRIGRYFLGDQKTLPQDGSRIKPDAGDLQYHLNIAQEEAHSGTEVQIVVDRGRGRERFNVKIPPGTKEGTLLRLKGKGRLEKDGSGDLYLNIHVSDT